MPGAAYRHRARKLTKSRIELSGIALTPARRRAHAFAVSAGRSETLNWGMSQAGRKTQRRQICFGRVAVAMYFVETRFAAPALDDLHGSTIRPARAQRR